MICKEQGEEQQEENGQRNFYRIPDSDKYNWILHYGNRQAKGEKTCLEDPGKNAFSYEHSGREYWNLGGDVRVPS